MVASIGLVGPSGNAHLLRGKVEGEVVVKVEGAGLHPSRFPRCSRSGARVRAARCLRAACA